MSALAASPAPSDVTRFRDAITSRLGLYFDEGKLDYLAEVLAARMSHASTSDYATYADRLETKPEIRALAETLTIGETYFFRYRDQLRAFVDVVLGARAASPTSSRTLRILSAGCASGEELYSLAILLRENLPALSTWELQLVGIDLNPAALEKATNASYSAWSLRDTPEDVRKRWFCSTRSGHRLDDEVRSMARFEERNLMDPDPAFWRPDTFDVVFCRNVLMYFSPQGMAAVVSRIERVLTPGGFLFLGHAETLRGISQRFHLCHTHETFYYRKRAHGEAADGAGASHVEVERSSRRASLEAPSSSWVDAIEQASLRIERLSLPRGTPSSAPASPRVMAPAWDLAPALELLRQERFSAAMELLHSLPEISRMDRDARILRAVLLTNRGLVADAEEACREMLAADDLDSGAHYLMALCREHAGDLAGAIEHDQSATYLDDTFVMPHLHLGLLARRTGDLARARAELTSALSLLPREDPARILLFGGGFRREALAELCRAELIASEVGR